MEQERERQREWEESQKETASRRVDGKGVDGVGGGIGGKWDVNRELCHFLLFYSFYGSIPNNCFSSFADLHRMDGLYRRRRSK